MQLTITILFFLLSTSCVALTQTQWKVTWTDTTGFYQWIDCADSLNCLIAYTPFLSSDIVISKSSNGGRTFDSFVIPEDDTYLGIPQHISYPSVDTAFILLEHGQIFRSIDGGISWDLVSIIRDLPLGYFTPPHFLTSQRGIVASRGISGTPDSTDQVYRTLDGGQTWDRKMLPSPPGDSVIHPMAIHEFEGGRISVLWYGIRSSAHYFSTSTDEGSTWQHVKIPESKGFFTDFVAVSESTYYFTFVMREDVQPVGRYQYSLVYESIDHGKTWNTVFNGLGHDTIMVGDLAFQDSNSAIATINSGVLRTTDGFQSWVREDISPTLTWRPFRLIASYPMGSDGILLVGGGDGGYIFLPDVIGGVTDPMRQKARLMNVHLSPLRISNEYLLSFESLDRVGVSICLYDVLGSAIFSTEYETTVGPNSVVLDLPLHTSRTGFVRILSDGSDVTLPIILD